MPRTSAIVILNHSSSNGSERQDDVSRHPSALTGSRLVCVDVLGRSVLERTLTFLESAGIRDICVISDSFAVPRLRGRKVISVSNGEECWQMAVRKLHRRASARADLVLLVDLRAYAEFDLGDALQFHDAKRQTVTPLYDEQGALGWWIVNPGELTSNWHFSLPWSEDRMANPPVPYFVDGYTNRLTTVHELRKLVIDSFLKRCSIVPGGSEVRPGVWVDAGARLHRNARVVAPAYIGRKTLLRPGVVVTRFSNLEQECVVGEGSVVSNASILAHTTIGCGLDVCSAVVDGGMLVDLSRNLHMQIEDPCLMRGAVPVLAERLGARGEVGSLEHPRAAVTEDSYFSRAAGRLLEVFKGEV